MKFEQFFFAGGPEFFRAILCRAPDYGAIVVLLRASGKRTLAKMNAFDLVVTRACPLYPLGATQ